MVPSWETGQETVLGPWRTAACLGLSLPICSLGRTASQSFWGIEQGDARHRQAEDRDARNCSQALGGRDLVPAWAPSSPVLVRSGWHVHPEPPAGILAEYETADPAYPSCLTPTFTFMLFLVPAADPPPNWVFCLFRALA